MRRAGVLPPSMCGSQGLRCARRRSRPMSERRRRFCVGSTLVSELPTRSILRSRNGFGQSFPLSIKNWRQAQGSLEYQWSQHEATRNSPPCPVSASTSTLKTRCPASGLSADQLRGGATFRTKFRWGERVRARDGSAARIAELDVSNVEEGY